MYGTISGLGGGGKKEGETRDLLPFKERGRETWTTTVVVEEA